MRKINIANCERIATGKKSICVVIDGLNVWVSNRIYGMLIKHPEMDSHVIHLFNPKDGNYYNWLGVYTKAGKFTRF